MAVFHLLLINFESSCLASPNVENKIMSTKKSGGSTSLGRDSNSQRLGVKLYAGEKAQAGSIIIRQRGTKYHPGRNVKIGKDDTLFAIASGVVKFSDKKIMGFNNKLRQIKVVNVVEQKIAE